MRIVCFDLDDTLYKEIDYLKSAYREIARFAVECCGRTGNPASVLMVKANNEMLNAFLAGGNAFEKLNEYLGLDIPIAEYLAIYREHKPSISLDEDAVKTLDWLKENDFIIGLITDGRVNSQTAKIEALGLNQWIKPEDIIISESFGSDKTCARNYRYFMEKYPECLDYTYVGDNPLKDFVSPNALGWNTVCLLDDGRNVHKQDFSLPKEYLPQNEIKNIREFIDYVTR